VQIKYFPLFFLQIKSLISVKQMFTLTFAGITLQNHMKHILNILLVLFILLFISTAVQAQCAVCTKTASQLGEKPAQGMNSAILYLMFAPFAIIGFIGYRWWKGNKKLEEAEATGNEQ
jgi:heme/copper-type cytochrome/quinol oxidase subunit 2